MSFSVEVYGGASSSQDDLLSYTQALTQRGYFPSSSSSWPGPRVKNSRRSSNSRTRRLISTTTLLYGLFFDVSATSVFWHQSGGQSTAASNAQKGTTRRTRLPHSFVVEVTTKLSKSLAASSGTAAAGDKKNDRFGKAGSPFNAGYEGYKRLEVMFGGGKKSFECEIPSNATEDNDRIGHLARGKLAMLDTHCVVMEPVSAKSVASTSVTSTTPTVPPEIYTSLQESIRNPVVSTATRSADSELVVEDDPNVLEGYVNVKSVDGSIMRLTHAVYDKTKKALEDRATANGGIAQTLYPEFFNVFNAENTAGSGAGSAKELCFESSKGAMIRIAEQSSYSSSSSRNIGSYAETLTLARGKNLLDDEYEPLLSLQEIADLLPDIESEGIDGSSLSESEYEAIYGKKEKLLGEGGEDKSDLEDMVIDDGYTAKWNNHIGTEESRSGYYSGNQGSSGRDREFDDGDSGRGYEESGTDSPDAALDAIFPTDQDDLQADLMRTTMNREAQKKGNEFATTDPFTNGNIFPDGTTKDTSGLRMNSADQGGRKVPDQNRRLRFLNDILVELQFPKGESGNNGAKIQCECAKPTPSALFQLVRGGKLNYAVSIGPNRILSPACCSYKGRPNAEDLLWPVEGICGRFQPQQYKSVAGMQDQELYTRSWWTTELCLNRGDISQFHLTKEGSIHGSTLLLGKVQPHRLSLTGGQLMQTVEGGKCASQYQVYIIDDGRSSYNPMDFEYAGEKKGYGATYNPLHVDKFEGYTIKDKNNEHGCTDFDTKGDPDQFRGKILLVKRGQCWFHEKSLRAEKVGAAGVIIVNDHRPMADIMEGIDSLPAPRLVSLLVDKDDGHRLWQKANEKYWISVTKYVEQEHPKMLSTFVSFYCSAQWQEGLCPEGTAVEVLSGGEWRKATVHRELPDLNHVVIIQKGKAQDAAKEGDDGPASGFEKIVRRDQIHRLPDFVSCSADVIRLEQVDEPKNCNANIRAHLAPLCGHNALLPPQKQDTEKISCRPQKKPAPHTKSLPDTRGADQAARQQVREEL